MGLYLSLSKPLWNIHFRLIDPILFFCGLLYTRALFSSNLSYLPSSELLARLQAAQFIIQPVVTTGQCTFICHGCVACFCKSLRYMGSSFCEDACLIRLLYTHLYEGLFIQCRPSWCLQLWFFLKCQEIPLTSAALIKVRSTIETDIIVHIIYVD